MAEQAINTIYLLGEHPDRLCNELLKDLACRTFNRKPTPSPQPQTQSQIQEDKDMGGIEENLEVNTLLQPQERAESVSNGTFRRSQTPALSVGSRGLSQSLGQTPAPIDLGDAFLLSQLIFVVGHVAIKHIVYLEIVEKECKRQKEEKDKEEKSKDKGNQTVTHLDKFDIHFLSLAKKSGSKETGEELDQVAGNAEDEIGERIAAIRETELLYGPESLLGLFGPMIIHICGSPHKFKVGRFSQTKKTQYKSPLDLEPIIAHNSDAFLQ